MRQLRFTQDEWDRRVWEYALVNVLSVAGFLDFDLFIRSQRNQIDRQSGLPHRPSAVYITPRSVNPRSYPLWSIHWDRILSRAQWKRRLEARVSNTPPEVIPEVPFRK